MRAQLFLLTANDRICISYIVHVNEFLKYRFKFLYSNKKGFTVANVRKMFFYKNQ